MTALPFAAQLAALRIAYACGRAGTPAPSPLGPHGDAAEALGLRHRMRAATPTPDGREAVEDAADDDAEWDAVFLARPVQTAAMEASLRAQVASMPLVPPHLRALTLEYAAYADTIDAGRGR
jgi:hypothetical protein